MWEIYKQESAAHVQALSNAGKKEKKERKEKKPLSNVIY